MAFNLTADREESPSMAVTSSGQSEFQGMDTDDVAQIAAPAQYGTENVVALRQIHLIGDRSLADHHWAYMAENHS
jgi:hypothetical protein